jgi:DNA-binding HxlR family transcriptional regulator
MSTVPLGRIPRIDRSERLAETSELSACMSLIGGAWAPHIIWHLRSGPRRFGELRLDIPGLSNRVLSQRLKDLESRGVVSRTLEVSCPVSGRYLLTPLGRKLLPALRAIVDVGRKHGGATENGSSSAMIYLA